MSSHERPPVTVPRSLQLSLDAMPAAGYLRRSTDLQDQSLGDQRKEIEAKAARKGFRIVRWYEDDAVSGTSTTGRDQFNQMLLCFMDLDRFRGHGWPPAFGPDCSPGSW